MTDRAPLVELQDVSAGYRGRRVIDGVSLSLRAGELTVIVGPNGAGKSTLLKLMTGELAPGAGRVLLGRQDIAHLSPAALARRRAVLPQSSALAFPFTVAEVVRLGLEAGGRRHDPKAVARALARVELEGFAGRFYNELSGGERQRVHLARVLCQIGEPVEAGEPRLLFLDEPVSSLDLRHQLGVLAIAREFAEKGGCAVAILHDLNLATAYADRLVVVAGGRIDADGTPATVVRDNMLRSVFDVTLRVGVVPPAGVPFVLPQSERRN